MAMKLLLCHKPHFILCSNLLHESLTRRQQDLYSSYGNKILDLLLLINLHRCPMFHISGLWNTRNNNYRCLINQYSCRENTCIYNCVRGTEVWKYYLVVSGKSYDCILTLLAVLLPSWEEFLCICIHLLCF